MPEPWPPDTDAEGFGPACARCGSFVSAHYYRLWSDGGELDGCRHCLPRSIRFGQDVYGRNKDDIEFSGSDPGDRGTKPAPSSRAVGTMSGPNPLEDYDDFRADSPAALLDDD